MAKRTQKQKQKQRQSLTNIIKIALDKKRTTGRRRVRRQPKEDTAQMAQQQLLTQLLLSNQPVRSGQSILDRTFQDERLRNIERQLRTVNDLAKRTFADGSMSGPTSTELLAPPPAPKKEEPPLGIPEPPVRKPRKSKKPPVDEGPPLGPSIREMRKFLRDFIKFVPPQEGGRKYTKNSIKNMDSAEVEDLYNRTVESVREDPEAMAGAGGGGADFV